MRSYQPIPHAQPHRPPNGGSRRLAWVLVGLWCLPTWTHAGNPRASNQSLVSVNTIRATASSSYATNRTYAGAIVAGRASELGFKHAGELAEITVDVGCQVQQGQRLATLNNDSVRAALAQARAQVDVARANIAALRAETEMAQQSETRFANLRKAGHVSAAQYDDQRLTLESKQAQQRVGEAGLVQAKASQRAAEVAVAEAQILAPFSGTVQARHADEGSQLSPGQAVLRLVETANKEAHVGLPEQMAANLQRGATYQLRWADQTIPAVLSAILPEVDSENRTLKAIYQLSDEHSGTLPIGALVELAMTSEVSEPGFWVPLSALTESGRGLWGVYVVTGQQRIARRLVEVVHTESNRVFVRGTLQDNEHVVASGVQRLVPGQRVAYASAPSG